MFSGIIILHLRQQLAWTYLIVCMKTYDVSADYAFDYMLV